MTHSARLNAGFSLIELMIGLCILAVLSTMAYPSYEHMITRSRRAQAQTALFELAERMEQYYAKEYSYQGATLKKLRINPISQEGFYQLSIETTSDSDYDLAAIPLNSQALHDKQCQSLTLSKTGNQGIAAGPSGQPLGRVSDCWY